MRQNPSFAMTDVAELRRVIADNPWATLVRGDGEGMTASHYAVLLDPDRDDLTVVGHVGRPGDHVLGLGEGKLLLVFQGPHGVVAVPTWNYVAVHLAGTPELLSTEENLRILEHLVAHFEESRPQSRGMWAPPNDVIENVILQLSEDGSSPNPALAAEMRRAHDARVPVTTGSGDGARS